METEKIIVTNLLFQNDEGTIKKGLLKLNGVAEVIINPENNQVEVTYEHIDRDKIINRLYALGYFEDDKGNTMLFQMSSSPIALPQNWN
ncbi:heavy metal-associated domain-containing protein [Flavobacterium paronense]|uniref:Heavy-metal-associated domain-containing protein n=1 Tax=Flavobacterium paronense TaxID=1392775 RepID=A0ABV5GC39_9FLAO|nr:heavy metal-associated domain-containing protein [Flavobacterium paronense]MDN3677806.1 heavy metal-associated domain-containing protein [Flavobacterium paronense]